MITASLAAAALFATIFITGLAPLFLRWKSHHLDVFLSFGAGVLLSAAFLHMFPDATEHLGSKAGLWVLLGFLALFSVEKFTMAHACGEEACPNHKVGLSALIGLSVHSVLSGVALGAAVSDADSPTMAAAMLFAVLVHKVPETLALAAMFLSSQWSRGKSLAGLTGFALMGPLGILLSQLGLQGSPEMAAILLALSTGTFLYIASSDLLPHLHRKEAHRWLDFLVFVVGLFLLALPTFQH